MYLPAKIDANFKIKLFFEKFYLPTDNCIGLDKQIGELNQDIAHVTKLLLKSNGLDELMQKSVKKRLLEILKTRQNQSALLDCRNKIETIRQEETANIFTETSAYAEKRILNETKKKQYFLIGIGSIILLTTLFIITKKK